LAVHISCDEADGGVGGCGKVIVDVFADCSTGGWSLSARFQWARSTTMLWVEGLAPAIAEKFFDGVLGGGVL